MALNEIYVDANEISLPVHTSVTSGKFVKVSDVVGVALANAKAGEDGNTYATLKLSGAFTIPFKSGDTFDVGQKAYGVANATTGIIPEAQESATSAKLIGHVIKVTTTDVVVRLAQN
jgi:predicted RecA/RadA family phage recombinase